MRALLIGCALVMAMSGVAVAEDEGLFGELHINLQGTRYTRVAVDGHEWHGHEFERDGARLLIKGLDLERDSLTVTLTPFDRGFEAAELTVTPKDFRRQRRGRVFLMIATATVRFERKKVDEPTPEPAPERKPAPPPHRPPSPDDDFDL